MIEPERLKQFWLHKLGFDLGGVILDRKCPGRSFTDDHFLEAPEIPDAFNVLEKLTLLFSPENIFLISKVREDFKNKTQAWLAHHRFYLRTGIRKANVLFCAERQGKLPCCQRYGISHFVDDRMETHGYLHPHIRHLYLFQPLGAPPSDKRQNTVPVTVVRSWEEVYNMILVNTGIREKFRAHAHA